MEHKWHATPLGALRMEATPPPAQSPSPKSESPSKSTLESVDVRRSTSTPVLSRNCSNSRNDKRNNQQRQSHVRFGVFGFPPWKDFTSKLAALSRHHHLSRKTNNTASSSGLESDDTSSVTTEAATATSLGSQQRPGVPKGILKPYKGHKYTRFGFSYDRPFHTTEKAKDGQPTKTVTFGKALNVTVYHYPQVDLDETTLPPPSTSPSTLSLLGLSRRGRDVHPKKEVVKAIIAQEHGEDVLKEGVRTPKGDDEPEEVYQEELAIPLPSFSEYEEEEEKKGEDLTLDELKKEFHVNKAMKSASFSPGSASLFSQQLQGCATTPRKSVSARGNMRPTTRGSSRQTTPKRVDTLSRAAYRMM